MKRMMKHLSLIFALVLVVSLLACTPASTPQPEPTSSSAAEPVAPRSTEAPAPAPTEAQSEDPVAPEATQPVEPAKPAEASEPADGVTRISVEELKALVDAGENILIVDTRPRESYQLSHIKGAISLPWKPELSLDDTEELPSGRAIVTYCDCGPGEADGADTARQLIEMGFKDVKALADPSVNGWIELGYPSE